MEILYGLPFDMNRQGADHDPLAINIHFDFSQAPESYPSMCRYRSLNIGR